MRHHIECRRNQRFLLTGVMEYRIAGILEESFLMPVPAHKTLPASFQYSRIPSFHSLPLHDTANGGE
jgi:hypothetical protein